MPSRVTLINRDDRTIHVDFSSTTTDSSCGQDSSDLCLPHFPPTDDIDSWSEFLDSIKPIEPPLSNGVSFESTPQPLPYHAELSFLNDDFFEQEISLLESPFTFSDVPSILEWPFMDGSGSSQGTDKTASPCDALGSASSDKSTGLSS